ncbi:MAG: hypothetical protein QXK06_03745 [Candidatus Diapherotrites archaeon]
MGKRRSRQKHKPPYLFKVLPKTIKTIGRKEKSKIEKPAINILALRKPWPQKYKPLQATIQTAIGEINVLHMLAMEARANIVGPLSLRFRAVMGQSFPRPELIVDPKKISRKKAIHKARELSRIIAQLQNLARVAGVSAAKAEKGLKEIDSKDCPKEVIGTANLALGRMAEISIEAREILWQLGEAQRVLELYASTGATRLPLKPD